MQKCFMTNTSVNRGLGVWPCYCVLSFREDEYTKAFTSRPKIPRTPTFLSCTSSRDIAPAWWHPVLKVLPSRRLGMLLQNDENGVIPVTGRAPKYGYRLTTDELWSVASTRILAWSILQVCGQVCAVRDHPPNSAAHSMPVCWDMLPCSLVECYWCSRKYVDTIFRAELCGATYCKVCFFDTHPKIMLISSPLHFLPKNYSYILISLFPNSLPLALSQLCSHFPVQHTLPL